MRSVIGVISKVSDSQELRDHVECPERYGKHGFSEAPPAAILNPNEPYPHCVPAATRGKPPDRIEEAELNVIADASQNHAVTNSRLDYLKTAV